MNAFLKEAEINYGDRSRRLHGAHDGAFRGLRFIETPDVRIFKTPPVIEDSITIQLNGRPHPLARGANVSALLTNLGFAAQPVLVERNGTALFPRDFPATVLDDKDVIEVIRIVAGG